MSKVAPAGSGYQTAGEWAPRIVAFTCNWCSYSGADMAGTARLTYPANVRIVRMLCSGRMDPLFALKAFEEGADGVLVSGCHPGDCHYVQGNLYARRRLEIFADLMELLGLDPRRLHFAWVSASEGVKWSELIGRVTRSVLEAGPNGEWLSAPTAEFSSAKLPEPGPPPRTAPTRDANAATTSHLRQLARRLLEEGEVSRVIGYAEGAQSDQMVPAFVETPEDAERLVWNERCYANLANYAVHRSGGATALIAKTCDAKSIAGLLRENQLRRDEVVVVGVSCSGIWHGDRLAAKCYGCDENVSPLADWTVGPDGTARGSIPAAGRDTSPDPRDAALEALSSLPPDERLAFWQGEFDRCIRCYACRAVCPMCYCDTCITDKHRPQWISAPQSGPGNTSWNVVRAMHLAGRCSDCDECARVCPSGIRLDLINRSLAQGIKRKYGTMVSADPAVKTALTTYRPDDAGRFV